MALLGQKVSGLNVWEYGSRLTDFLKSRGSDLSNQDELRARSADVVRPSDIDELDDELLRWTATNRLLGHTVIDSHPVTKEEYGFRVTAFSLERFQSLRPTEIWLFYVPPELAVERIARDPAGRPSISIEEARMHSFAQASVACTFGIAAGCPVYMFDTAVDQTTLVDDLATRLLA